MMAHESRQAAPAPETQQTGMLPAASPTKRRKSSSFVPEADVLPEDLHNKINKKTAGKKPAVGSTITSP